VTACTCFELIYERLKKEVFLLKGLMVGIENVVSSRAINLATPYPITGKLAILVHYSYCVKEPVPEQRKLLRAYYGRYWAKG